MLAELIALLRIKSDVSKIEADMKRLTGVEKEAAEQAVSTAKARDSMFEKWAIGLAKVQYGYGLVKTGVELADQAVSAWEKTTGRSAQAWRDAKAEWDKGFDQIKSAIGEVVIALSPLIQALGEVLGLVGRIASSAAEGISDFGGGVRSFVGGKVGGGDWLQQQIAARNAAVTQGIVDQVGNMLGQFAQQFGPGYGGVDAAMPSWGGVRVSKESTLDAQLRAGHISKAEYDREMAKARGGGAGGAFSLDYAQPLGPGFTTNYSYYGANLSSGWGAESRGRNFFLSESADLGNRAYSSFDEKIGSYDLLGAQERMAGIATQFQSEQQQSYLASIFGPVDEFDAYATGFQILTSAAQSAFDAWVSGQATAGQALKMFVGQALSATSSAMWGEGLKHGAWAIGDLAFGNVAGATKHGIAAALFGAGAIATGAAARAWGGTGAPAGAGASGGAPSVLGPYQPAGDSGPRSATVVIGANDADDSPRQRARRVGRGLRAAHREIGGDWVFPS